MNKAQLLTTLIQSGRVSIIPVGFTGEEGEGEKEREGASE